SGNTARQSHTCWKNDVDRDVLIGRYVHLLGELKTCAEHSYHRVHRWHAVQRVRSALVGTCREDRDVGLPLQHDVCFLQPRSWQASDRPANTVACADDEADAFLVLI